AACPQGARGRAVAAEPRALLGRGVGVGGRRAVASGGGGGAPGRGRREPAASPPGLEPAPPPPGGARAAGAVLGPGDGRRRARLPVAPARAGRACGGGHPLEPAPASRAARRSTDPEPRRG